MASSSVSSVVNHFSNANEGFITTLGSSILSGATTVPLAGVSGLTNGDIFVGIIEPGLTNQQVFTGTVDTGGSQITGVVWTRGSNINHTAGVTIVDYVTGTAHNMIKKGILVAHSQDGTHKSGATYASPVFSGTATGTYTMAGTGTYTAPTLTTPVIKTFDGWQSGSGTWTYVSATTFTVPAGDAAVLGKGTRIKLTQTTVKYFYVVGISGTTVTITGGTDYTLANAAITLPFFSNESTPYQFPQGFNYTPTETGFTSTTPTRVARFWINGNACTISTTRSNNQASNATTYTFSLPVTAKTVASQTWRGMGTGQNNGAALTTAVFVQVASAATVANLYTDGNTGGWTAASTKGADFDVTYEI